jgi:hypothetical protein
MKGFMMALEEYWKEIAAVLGFGALWFKSGREVGNIEQQIKKIADKEYCTKEDCETCRTQCQTHTWDKLLLALEKRDRDFDKKFMNICGGIQRIEQKLENIK